MDKIGLLTGKVCLVTGTSKGIGKEIVKCFVEAGGTVYANARQEGCLDEWADQVNAKSVGKVIPIYFDVTDSVALKQVAVRLKKEQGQLDVLVNNAGKVSNEMLGMITKNKLTDMFDVNVFGPLELTQMVATRFMMKQKTGSIINISSIVGAEGCKGQIAYSASKGAVISMTKSMAKELASYNVRVNAVAPGMIATERLKNTIEDQYKGQIPYIGMGRLGEPDEVANTCLYLASDMSSYTTGQIIVVGGSMTP